MLLRNFGLKKFQRLLSSYNIKRGYIRPLFLLGELPNTREENSQFLSVLLNNHVGGKKRNDYRITYKNRKNKQI